MPEWHEPGSEGTPCSLCGLMLLFYNVCWILIPAPWAGGWRMKGVWRGWRAIYECAGHASAVRSLKLLSRWRRNTAHTLCEAFLHCSLGQNSQAKHDWEHGSRIRLFLIERISKKKSFRRGQATDKNYFSKSLVNHVEEKQWRKPPKNRWKRQICH